jgi:hypothetical protein
MRVKLEDQINNNKKLLSAWSVKDIKPLTYSQIIKHASTQGLNKRTVIRRLKEWTKAGKIEKEAQLNGRFLYRPKSEFLRFMMDFQLGTLGTDNEERIISWLKAKDPVDKSFDKIKKWYVGYVDDEEAENCPYRDERKEVSRSRRLPPGSGLSPEGSQELDEKIDGLIGALRSSLSVDYLKGDPEPVQIYELLCGKVTDVMSAYMALWAFMAQTYAAPRRFDEQMQAVEEALKEFRKKMRYQDYA